MYSSYADVGYLRYGHDNEKEIKILFVLDIFCRYLYATLVPEATVNPSNMESAFKSLFRKGMPNFPILRVCNENKVLMLSNCKLFVFYSRLIVTSQHCHYVLCFPSEKCYFKSCGDDILWVFWIPVLGPWKVDLVDTFFDIPKQISPGLWQAWSSHGTIHTTKGWKCRPAKPGLRFWTRFFGNDSSLKRNYCLLISFWSEHWD